MACTTVVEPCEFHKRWLKASAPICECHCDCTVRDGRVSVPYVMHIDFAERYRDLIPRQGLSECQLASMLRDVEHAEKEGDKFSVADVCGHVRDLLAEVRRLRGMAEVDAGA